MVDNHIDSVTAQNQEIYDPIRISLSRSIDNSSIAATGLIREIISLHELNLFFSNFGYIIWSTTRIFCEILFRENKKIFLNVETVANLTILVCHTIFRSNRLFIYYNEPSSLRI